MKFYENLPVGFTLPHADRWTDRYDELSSPFWQMFCKGIYEIGSCFTEDLLYVHRKDELVKKIT